MQNPSTSLEKKPSPSPAPSTDIGQDQTPRTPANQIGTAHGATGLTVTPPASSQLVVAWAEGRPTTAEAAVMASLPAPIVSWLRWMQRNARDMQTRGLTQPTLSDEHRQLAIAAYEQLLQPCTDVEIVKRLTRLKVMTVGRGLSADDQDAQFAAYVAGLRTLPADVTRFLLTSAIMSSRWWPSWSELVEHDQWTNDRKRTLSMLKNPPQPTHQIEKPRADPKFIADLLRNSRWGSKAVDNVPANE